MSIKTLSPYYVSVPLTNPLTGVVCASYVAKIFIWSGSKTAAPGSPVYEMTKINASGSSGTDKLNISRIISDFIEFSCEAQSSTVLVNSNNQVWAKIECYYNDVPQVPGLQEVHLAIKGYGYFTEGENPQLPQNKILLTGNEFKVNRGGTFVLPLLADEPEVEERTLSVVDMYRVSGNTYTVDAQANFTYSQLYLFVREVGTTEWIAATVTGSNFTIPSSIALDRFEFRISAYDLVTAEVINSTTNISQPTRIFSIVPFNSGMSIYIYSVLNINVEDIVLQVYGVDGPVWTSINYTYALPIQYAFASPGNYKVRLRAQGANELYTSNEVNVTIPLTGTINI